MDWRFVAGFLGDYGIGNAMEKNDAEASATKRMNQLNGLYAQKHFDAEPMSARAGIAKFIDEALGAIGI